MEFFTRVLSGNSRLKAERAREAEQFNQTFKENLNNLKRVLESEEIENVLALLDMVYESSFPEEQVFMKIPSRARLRSKKELVVRLLIGLDSLGVPVMAEMLAFVKKHGPEAVADSLMTLLEYLSPLLEGKEAPRFSTDDVVDAMDFGWHSTSRVGSPLLNVIASTTSSPRASAASNCDSPLHPIISGSPYRRAISDRSMLVSRPHELGAKSVLDKTSTASMPPRPSLTMSASSQYPSVNQDFPFRQPAILEAPASPEIIQDSTDEYPSLYSLDTLPASSQHGLQKKHRRKSSSLQQLLTEDANDELSREGSVGASSKRYSSSSSLRRNSSELMKTMNPGLAATGDSSREGAYVALDKESLTSIDTQDRHVNRSSRKGSRRIPDEFTLWREDSGGFSVDLVPSNESDAQTLGFPPIQLKSSLDIPIPTEGHAGIVEAASIYEDLIKSSKINILEQEDILPASNSSSLSSNDLGESLNTVPQIAQSPKSDVTPGNELSEAEEGTEKSIFDKEAPSDCIDVKRGRLIGKQCNSTEKPLETEEVMSYMKQNQTEESESAQDANDHHGDGKLEAIDSATNDGLLTAQRKFSEDVNVHSTSTKENEMEMQHIDGYGASCQYIDGSTKIEDVNPHSISDNDNDMNVENASACSSSDHSDDHIVHGRSGARSHEHSYPSSDSDGCDRSSSQISIASKSSTATQERKADDDRLPDNQLNRNAFEAPLDNVLRTKQSNVLQHAGHQRSHSDLTPVRNLFKAESLKQEKFNPQHGSESDSHVQRTDKLRRKFARHLRSLTASMESLRSRGGFADRVDSMPWMRMKTENKQHREEAREEHEKGSFSDVYESTSSGASGRVRAPHEVGRPLVLHYLEAEVVHAVDGDDLSTHELGYIPALVEYADCNNPMQDHGQVHQANPNFQVVEPSFEQESGPSQMQSTADTESTAPFTGRSGTQCGQVVGANESQPLHDIQRSAVHFTELEPYAGSFTVDNAAHSHADMHHGAGLIASLEDHEHQANNLFHVFPLSNKTDPPVAVYTPVHGHPTSSSTLESEPQSDQHVLNQPATFSDPTWDMDINVPRSKRKGDCMAQLARGCLLCCTKPHTNS